MDELLEVLNRIAISLEVIAAVKAGQWTPPPPKVSVPDDYPARDWLVSAGLSEMSFDKVPRKGEDLARMGMPPVMINAVLAWWRGQR